MTGYDNLSAAHRAAIEEAGEEARVRELLDGMPEPMRAMLVEAINADSTGKLLDTLREANAAAAVPDEAAIVTAVALIAAAPTHLGRQDFMRQATSTIVSALEATMVLGEHEGMNEVGKGGMAHGAFLAFAEAILIALAMVWEGGDIAGEEVTPASFAFGVAAHLAELTEGERLDAWREAREGKAAHIRTMREGSMEAATLRELDDLPLFEGEVAGE